MPRRDPLNSARFRTAPDLGDVQLLRADFQTHRFERHVHDELVIAVTERGAGQFFSRGIQDIASAREVAVFNPGEPHEGGVFDSRHGWCYRAIYLGPWVLQHLAETVVGTHDVVPYVRRNTVPDMRLARLVLMTHAVLEASTTRLTRQTHFLDAYAHLVGAHADMSAVPATMTPARARVARALELMHDRSAENLSVEDLAAATALSPFHFIRTFRRGLGMPPHAYLTQVRLRQAREGLAAGRAPADVALAAGFADQSHMTKHFKRSFGITPAQYAAALDSARPSTRRDDPELVEGRRVEGSGQPCATSKGAILNNTRAPRARHTGPGSDGNQGRPCGARDRWHVGHWACDGARVRATRLSGRHCRPRWGAWRRLPSPVVRLAPRRSSCAQT